MGMPFSIIFGNRSLAKSKNSFSGIRFNALRPRKYTPVLMRSESVSRAEGFSQSSVILPSCTQTEPYSPVSLVRESRMAASQPLDKNSSFAFFRSKSQTASPDMTIRTSLTRFLIFPTAPALPKGFSSKSNLVTPSPKERSENFSGRYMVVMAVEEKPFLRKSFKFRKSALSLAMGSRGLGVVSVSGERRLPKPPASITESKFVFSV